jgi:hypothetical protein
MNINNAINMRRLTPAFALWTNVSFGSATGDGTIFTLEFNRVTYDITSSYNTSTYEFTVPLAGRYLFNLSCGYGDGGATLDKGYLYISVNADRYILQEWNAYNGDKTRSSSLILDLAESDIIKPQIELDGGPKAATVFGQGPTGIPTTFSGVYLPAI